MPKPRCETGEKNLVGKQLIMLRKRDKISQRGLAGKLQLSGLDMVYFPITQYI